MASPGAAGRWQPLRLHHECAHADAPVVAPADRMFHPAVDAPDLGVGREAEAALRRRRAAEEGQQLRAGRGRDCSGFEHREWFVCSSATIEHMACGARAWCCLPKTDAHWSMMPHGAPTTRFSAACGRRLKSQMQVGATGADGRESRVRVRTGSSMEVAPGRGWRP